MQTTPAPLSHKVPHQVEDSEEGGQAVLIHAVDSAEAVQHKEQHSAAGRHGLVAHARLVNLLRRDLGRLQLLADLYCLGLCRLQGGNELVVVQDVAWER